MFKMLCAGLCVVGFLVVEAQAVHAQAVEVNEAGEKKAEGYFKARKPAAAAPAEPVAEASKASDNASSGGIPPRYMAVRVGTFFSDQAYRWGGKDPSNIGGLNAGVDYRLGEWVNTADLALRVDYVGYKLDEGAARKLSVGATVTFPDVASRFPLYFGAGIGAGFFIKQIRNESALSLDYSLFGGLRFLNVIDKIGFLVETGIKDHLLLTSDGQFNGVYFNVGSVFNF
jgi:hypothetical protein